MEHQFSLEQKPQNSSAPSVVKSKLKDAEDAENLVALIPAQNALFQDHNGENKDGSCYSHIQSISRRCNEQF